MPRTARPTRLRDHWRIRWLDHNGERCSTVFDSYRGADQQRRLKQAEAEEVRRGQRSAPPPEKTVGDALDYWLEKRAPRKRSSGDDQSIIRRHLRPAFGTLRLRELGIEHVDQFMAERAALNPKTVNNLLTLLIAVLNAAVDLGWLLKVPRIRKPSVRAFSADYRYLRSIVAHQRQRDDFREGPGRLDSTWRSRMAAGKKIEEESEARRCLQAAKRQGLSAGEWARAHGVYGRSCTWQMNLGRRADRQFAHRA